MVAAMRFLWGSKDGGPESRVRMWGIESKHWGSLLLLRFEPGTRESFHTHAFKSWSWVLAGSLAEQVLQEKGPTWTPDETVWHGYYPSRRPVHTDRRTFHRVAGGPDGAWVLTVRGPWWEGWREYNPATGEQVKLSNGRWLRDVLPQDVPELTATGSFPLVSVVCAVCRRRPSTAVCCVPGMPVSEAYCDTCLQGDAIPWDLCVANTACIGGLEHCKDEWRAVATATCKLNGRTLEDFCQQVRQAIIDMDAATGAEDTEHCPDLPPVDHRGE